MEIEEEVYEAEQIIDEKDQKPFFLIKWKGYPISESTWEPLEHVKSIGTQFITQI